MYKRQEIVSSSGEVRIGRTYRKIAFRGACAFLTPICVIGFLSAKFGFVPWWVQLVAAIFGAALSGIGIYSIFGLVHDQIHNGRRRGIILNLGCSLVAIVLGVSCYTYRRAHLAHHSSLGQKEKDPQYLFLDYAEANSDVDFLTDELQIQHSAPIKVFLEIMQEISGIAAKRDGYLFKSFFSAKAKKELYEQFSFTGMKRSQLDQSDYALNVHEAESQRRLDVLRAIYQTALILGLLFPVTRYASICALIAASVAALLNSYRASLEHSYVENKIDVLTFNRGNSSNTRGSNLFLKIVWYPVPWHALHHVVPGMPFFLLQKLHSRVQSELL